MKLLAQNMCLLIISLNNMDLLKNMKWLWILWNTKRKGHSGSREETFIIPVPSANIFCASKHKRHTKFIVAQYLQLYHDDMTLAQFLSSYTKHHKYKANIYAYDITGR